MNLGIVGQGRDNNFNLIRIVAAFAVLVTHSFALSIGSGDAEPFRHSLGMTIGTIAVDVFFATSGYLVAASLLSRQGVIEFAWARFLRIFPGLLTMLALTVFLLGPALSSLSLQSYFSDSRTYRYLAKCSTLFAGIAYTLPGVFDQNPYKGAVNGSLWTLVYEVHMYAILATTWFACRLLARRNLDLFRITIVSGAVISGIYVLVRHFYWPTDGQPVLFFMFFTGASFLVLRDRVRLSAAASWLIVVSLMGAAFRADVFFVVYLFSVAYLILCVAYVPDGFIRKYNRLGDYSYGVYIYAFPVQQMLAALIPGISVIQMLLLSAVATIVLSVASWHLIEKRSLALKGRYGGRRPLAAPSMHP